MAERDPCEVLGLAPRASKDEVHDAYRRLAKRWHPDLNAGDEPAEWRCKEIAAAHELLSDPLARERFDRGGGTAPDSLGMGTSSTAALRPTTGCGARWRWRRWRC
jgi:curved DNA-binding protein CbpA